MSHRGTHSQFSILNCKFLGLGFSRWRHEDQPPPVASACSCGSAAVEAASPLGRELFQREALSDQAALEVRLVAHAQDYVVKDVRVGLGVGTMDVQLHPRIGA